MMRTEGESYSSYLNNIIDDHKTKNIKSICSYLLQTFSNKFDGFSSYIFGYANELLDLNFNFDQIKDQDSFKNYNYIKKDDILFRLNLSNEYQVDLGLFIYCILAIKTLKSNEYL